MEVSKNSFFLPFPKKSKRNIPNMDPKDIQKDI
jgi:hypothetical protein